MSAEIMQIRRLAAEIRLGILEGIKARGFGHVGGSLSVADVLAVLYGAVMRYDPLRPSWEERDKLVCSKGHAGPAVYAALALKGFFSWELLKTLNQPGTNLPSHCDHRKTPGVDMTTGSLGQGCSLAAGLALGNRLKGRPGRVFLIAGDGELNEGQAWESFMFAASQRLDNLTVFIDWNKKQLDGYVEEIIDPIDFLRKFEAFGFHAQQVDGNNPEEILRAVNACAQASGRPHAIVLDTVKGAGVRQVEETFSNHSMSPAPEACDEWISELRASIAEMEGGC